MKKIITSISGAIVLCLVIAYLLSHYANASIMTGAYLSDHPDLTTISNYEKSVGKNLAIVSWYQGWVSSDDTKNFQLPWMTMVRSHGSTPMITWEPWDYTKGVNQSEFTLREVISGRYDAYITKWAEDSAHYGSPFFLRFAHEMNNPVYPWCEQVNSNQAGDYILAWQHVHDIFVQNGATNVQWVWSVNVGQQFSNLYPGDNYVDWVAMDGYNGGSALPWGGWLSFTQVFKQTYDSLPTTKPVIISEMGSAEQGGSKANWITDAFTKEIKTMPRIKAFVWFNAEREANWKVNSSPASLRAYKKAMSSSLYSSSY